MFSLTALRELYDHLEWAEATVWTAALSSPAAASDADLRKLLQHIHSTQRVFLEVWTEQPVGKHYRLEFPSLGELYRWTRPYYAEVRQFLAQITEDRLAIPTPVPWARLFRAQLGRDAEVTTMGETLFQVTSHSTYHRAQVNSRLRALGSEPPLVDYIAWLWRGRPAPVWPAQA